MTPPIKVTPPSIDFGGSPPVRHLADSLVAADPYVAIAIARADARRYRAMLTTALDLAAARTRDLADARERYARLREEYRVVRDDLGRERVAARLYAAWLDDVLREVVVALGGAA
jgi:hypothetical protein